MTVENKLKGWRDATESLAPSPKLMAALEATLAAPPPPPAPASPGAPGAAGGGGVVTAVKVLLVTLVVGVVGYVATARRDGGPWRWFAQSAPPGQQLTQCPPRASAIAAAMPGMMLGGAAAEVDPRVEPLAQLEARPLECGAQGFPLRQLLQLRRGSDDELVRWATRYVTLCRLAGDRPWTVMWLASEPLPGGPDAGARAMPSACDDSDWCHKPTCMLVDRECATQWASRPLKSCNARTGWAWLLTDACQEFLRSTPEQREAASAEVLRAHAQLAASFGPGYPARPWCLAPAALAERDWLNEHHAVRETKR